MSARLFGHVSANIADRWEQIFTPMRLQHYNTHCDTDFIGNIYQNSFIKLTGMYLQNWRLKYERN